MVKRSHRASSELHLDGSLWLKAGDTSLGGHGRIALLKAVAEAGSITAGAKAFGMSYKAAWDAIDAMNRAAGAPLVERSTGGRGGGATRLTERGRRLVERYAEVDAVHRRFLQRLDATALDLDQDFSLLKVLQMKTSARNQFVGSVSALRAGAVNDEVELALPGGTRIVAQLTRESTLALGLKMHMTALALVKSSSVMLATGLDDTQGRVRLSARNQLGGTVASVTPGAVNAEVVLALDGGDGTLAAIITQGSCNALGLAPGVRATALFKASSVVLAVID